MKYFNLLNRQRGFSSICLVTSLAFFALVGYVGIQVAPSYIDYRNISNALDEVSRMDNFESMRRGKIISRINESIHRNTGFEKPNLDINEVVYVKTENGRKLVGANYEVVVPLFYNVSALLHFKYEKFGNPFG